MKTILIIAPHFPPSALPPSQRVRLFIAHLHSLSWWPVVLTIQHNNREEIADPWMNTLTGDKFDTIPLNCISPQASRKFKFGDLGLRMLPYLPWPLIKQIKIQKPSFVLYPVPPWYIMIIAPLVKKITKVPYIIDFIDPWVHKGIKTGFKAKASQLIAKKFEGYVVKNSDGIIAVSQGILIDLISRHPIINNKPMLALPYGVEVADFDKVTILPTTNEAIILRYIGAISDAMLPVVDVLFLALKNIAETINFKFEFIGTSYAGKGLAQHKVQKIIVKTNTTNFITEQPNRIGYQTAITLTMQSDILFLIGDTTKYYAASKLMGLIASQKPFVAFVHKDSFPAQFLIENNYKYLVTYGDDLINNEIYLLALQKKIADAINDKNNFIPINTNNTDFIEHTAFGMTQKFTQLLNKIENGH